MPGPDGGDVVGAQQGNYRLQGLNHIVPADVTSVWFAPM